MLKKNNPGCDCCGDTRVCLDVVGCGNTVCGVPYDSGFAVDVVDESTGLTIATLATFPGTGPPYRPSFVCFTLPHVGSYQLVVSKSRYTTATATVVVDGSNYGTDIAARVDIAPAPGYGCTAFCKAPIKSVLKLFDGARIVDITTVDFLTWRASDTVHATGQLYDAAGHHGRCAHDAYGHLLPLQAIDIPVEYVFLGLCAWMRGRMGVCVDACFPGLADLAPSNAPISPPDPMCDSPFWPVSAAGTSSTTTDMTAVVSCEPLHLVFTMDLAAPSGAIWSGGWEITE